MVLNILGINGGNGVILHPFQKDKRFKILANVEPRALFLTPHDIQWRRNFHCPMLRSLPAPLKNVDIIVGAPDCGHSSILSFSRKKSLGNPKENKSLTMFIEGVNAYRPKLFLMENLPALLKTYGKGDLEEAFKEYQLTFIQSSVANFGNSQKTRKRLLIIGLRRGLPGIGIFKKPKLKEHKLKTCGKLLAKLPKDQANRESLNHIIEDIDTTITIYAGKKLQLSIIRKKWLKEFPQSTRWPVKNRKFTTAPGVYRNLKNQLPVTARKQNRQFNHKGLTMSARELARIQGVPDSFILHYESEKSQYWINKGRTTVTKTPPYEIGVWFKKKVLKLYANENNINP